MKHFKIDNISENYKKERAARPTDIIEIKALLELLYLGRSSRVNAELCNRSGTEAE